MIEDILDVSRIITGKARMRAEAVDLTAVLSSALETTQPAARAKRIVVRSELPADLGTLTGDADRLQQVVWNLLSNAVKFTPAGGLVRISATRTERIVSIEVEDEGVGIYPGFLPYVFDRFRQADAGSARAHGGLGIGLAIVRHIVEMHGDMVSVASRGVGHGALFAVQLPVQSAKFTPIPPAAAPPASEPKMPAFDALSGVSVLVVHDQADARDLMVAVLLQHGAEVHGAASVEEAIGILGRERVQVLVSDIAMPHEDGHALIHKAGHRRAPSTARDRSYRLRARQDRRRALEAGYQLHIAKPVDPAHFVLAIAGLLRDQAGPVTTELRLLAWPPLALLFRVF